MELFAISREVRAQGTAHPLWRELEFFEKQLLLFSRLCAGRNTYAINTLTSRKSFVDWDEAILCVNNTELLPRLRTAYCRFLLHAYVDIDPNYATLDTVDLNFVSL